MLIYIGLTILVVAISYFVNTSQSLGNRTWSHFESAGRRQACNRALVLAVFTLLFLVSALRIAVGNDYWVYRSNFLLIAQERHVSSEIGFNTIVQAIQYFAGYDNYIPIFTFFSFVTVLFLVKGIYDQSDCFGLSMLLVLTLGYYFSSLNSVRYYLALFMALYSLKYVIKGEYIRFILWILVAACFHKSVLIVIPIYFLATLSYKKWMLIPFAGICASMIFLQDVYRKIIFLFYPYYENSMFDVADISYTNVAKGIATVALGILFYKEAIKDNKQYRTYFYLNIAALALYLFGTYIPEISRIGYYLNISGVLLIPHILKCIPKKRTRILFTALTILACIGYFVLFLRSAYSVDVRLLPYLNWITD